MIVDIEIGKLQMIPSPVNTDHWQSVRAIPEKNVGGGWKTWGGSGGGGGAFRFGGRGFRRISIWMTKMK